MNDKNSIISKYKTTIELINLNRYSEAEPAKKRLILSYVLSH
jgi:hypothetical protein